MLAKRFLYLYVRKTTNILKHVEDIYFYMLENRAFQKMTRDEISNRKEIEKLKLYELRTWGISKNTYIQKYQRFTRLKGTKREKFGRMKSTSEPDVVK